MNTKHNTNPNTASYMESMLSMKNLSIEILKADLAKANQRIAELELQIPSQGERSCSKQESSQQ